jgi:hypothetical protein
MNAEVYNADMRLRCEEQGHAWLVFVARPDERVCKWCGAREHMPPPAVINANGTLLWLEKTASPNK